MLLNDRDIYWICYIASEAFGISTRLTQDSTLPVDMTQGEHEWHRCELALELEVSFGITIPNDVEQEWKTVQDVIDTVEQCLQKEQDNG